MKLANPQFHQVTLPHAFSNPLERKEISTWVDPMSSCGSPNLEYVGSSTSLAKQPLSSCERSLQCPHHCTGMWVKKSCYLIC